MFLDMGAIRWRLQLPYMTGAERATFKNLVSAGLIGFFRKKTCKNCSKDVPKIEEKLYCSKQCMIDWERDEKARRSAVRRARLLEVRTEALRVARKKKAAKKTKRKRKK